MAGFDAIAAAYVELRPKLASDFESQTTSDVVGAVGKVATAAAGVWASAKVFDAAKSGLAELNEASKVDSQTGTLLKNLGDSASITQGDVDKLGQSMLDLAGFDDEAARSAANVALRFGDAHNSGELQRFETTAANLAVTMGTDLPSAAQTLGVILQAPENAARRLRPIIGDLTDAQKESIKAFTDQGDVAGAQEVVYKALEQSIGGTAKSYGETLPAATDRAQESFKNLEADLVSGFAPAVGFAADKATAASEALQGMPEPLKLIAGGAVVAGTAVFGLIQPITGAVTAVNSLRTARLLNAGAADADTTATTAETGALLAKETATVSATTATVTDTAAKSANVTETAALTTAEQALEARRIQSIVTGEGYVSTEAQIIAAQQAEAAAIQEQAATAALALVSNDALIASTETLAATELAATEATLALAAAQREGLIVNSSAAVAGLYEEAAAAGALDIALGPVGIGLAAVAAAGAILQFSGALSGGRDDAGEAKTATEGLTAALKATTDEARNAALATTLFGDGATDRAREAGGALRDAGVPLKDFFAEVKRGTSDLGDLQHNSLATGDVIHEALRNAAKGGSEFAASLVAAADAGKLSDDQLVQIVQEANTLGGKYAELKGNADLAAGAATELGTAVDGVGDTSGADAQKAAIDSLKASADSAATSLESIIQAQRGLLSADLRVASGPDDIANVNARVEAARAKLGTGKTDAENAQLQRDYNQTVRDAESAVNDYAEATAEQAKQQDEANNVHRDGSYYLDVYSGKLHELAASETDGDIHQGLEFLIGGLDNTATAAQNASAAADALLNKQWQTLNPGGLAQSGIAGIAAAAALQAQQNDPNAAIIAALVQQQQNDAIIAALVQQQGQQKVGGGPRAYGGPVGPGFEGPVGELGEEWLSINTDGTGYVTPHSALPASGRSGSGAGGDVTILHVHGDPSPDAIAKWTREADRQSFLATGHTKRVLTLSRR